MNDFQIYANDGNLEVYDKYGASEYAAQFASVVKSTVEGANLGGIMALAAPDSHLYEALRESMVSIPITVLPGAGQSLLTR